MKTISRQDSTIAFMDSSPSELIHNSKDELIVTSLVNIFSLKDHADNKLTQFKNTRGLKRKLGRQQFIIDLIEKKDIAVGGSICWNLRNIAMLNAKTILTQTGLLKGNEQDFEIITISDYELSVGQFKSLAWLSFVITLFTHPLSELTNAERKKKAFIALDLISGDNQYQSRNFEVVRYLLKNTELKRQRDLILADNGLEGSGFVYGVRDGSTKKFKDEIGLSITDWITNSFYNLVKFDTTNLTEESDEYKLSKLARVLIERSDFRIEDQIILK